MQARADTASISWEDGPFSYNLMGDDGHLQGWRPGDTLDGTGGTGEGRLRCNSQASGLIDWVD